MVLRSRSISQKVATLHCIVYDLSPSSSRFLLLMLLALASAGCGMPRIPLMEYDGLWKEEGGSFIDALPNQC